MLKRLINSLENCPIVKREEYNYFIHPITDGVPYIDPALLREVATAMIRTLDLQNVDYIVTAEAMGIHIGSIISTMTDIPLSIIRKREYKLPGEVVVNQSTGYSENRLYINGIKSGDRIVIVDDVISTGGTIKSILPAFEQIGAEVVDICFAVKRGNAIIDMPFKYLVEIEVDDQVNIIDRMF